LYWHEVSFHSLLHSTALTIVSLAWAELYLTLGIILPCFEMELFETDVDDIAIKYDYLLMAPKLDTKGVRAKVKSRRW
jgi:hypothetical protein